MTQPTIGIHHHVPPEVYRAAPGMSQSTLKLALSDTEHLKYVIDGGGRDETDTMLKGTAFHTALVEPQRFKGYYRLWEKKERKGDGAFRSDLADARLQGVELYRSDWEIEKLVEAVRKHPDASAILDTPGHAEPSLWWERDGVLLKGRPDAVWLDQGIVIDVKTARSIRTRDIENAMMTLGYWLQSAMYIEGLLATTGRQDWQYYHLWVQTSDHPTVRVTRASDDGLSLGRRQLDEAFSIWRRCVHTGDWTAYPRVVELFPPTWAQRELNDAETMEGGHE